MKKKSIVSMSAVLRVLMCTSFVVMAGCAETKKNDGGYVVTPTVDYVERLDVYSAPHKDSFLNQLAMNYRSYAIYNARTSGYPDMGELFAQKAVAAFSGEVPFPENLDNWPVDDQQTSFELYTAYNDLMDQLKNDASDLNPELAAEAQAKFDCWLSATASGQTATAHQCRDRYMKALDALRNGKCGKVISKKSTTTTPVTNTMPVDARGTAGNYYADTRSLSSVRGASQVRDGVIIVNNVNVPEHLITPVSVQTVQAMMQAAQPVAQPTQPVQPIVFNQNIYGGDKTVSKRNISNNNNGNDNSRSANIVKKDISNNNNDNSRSASWSAETSSCSYNEMGVYECADEEPSEYQAVPSCQSCQSVESDCGCNNSCNKCDTCNDDCGASDDCGCECNQTITEEITDCGCDKNPTATAECVVNVETNNAPEIPQLNDQLVTRDEFINMMMAMREELSAINARLDRLQAAAGEKTMIKVQQIPLEPKQHVMEEVFEVRFDFNKAIIKPEYKDLIEKLATATQSNKNIKVSVIGHTDTVGSSNYNYALGGRRADAVQKMLIKYGIPASQIVAVSAGEEDLAVPTPDGVANAANRRVQVIKEVHYTEEEEGTPIQLEVGA